MPGRARALRACSRRAMAEPAKMRDFDPRVTPARADLAAKFLEGKVAARVMSRAATMEVVEPQAPLRHEPRPDAPLETEALKGERVTIYDENEEGWAWGQLAADHYVGWLPSMRWRRRAPRRRIRSRPAHVRVSRAVDQIAAHRSVSVRRETCRRAHRRSHGGDPIRHFMCRRFISSRSATTNPISSRSPNAFSARPICGAARPRSASTARAWCRLRSRPAAWRAHAIAICRNGRSGWLWASLTILRFKRGDLDILEGPRRHRVRRRESSSCQRLPHGGGGRTDCRGHGPYPCRGQRGHQRAGVSR